MAIKLEPIDLLRIHGDEERFEIIDMINDFVSKLNRRNPSIEQIRHIMKVLNRAVEESISKTKVVIEETVYCDHDGRPKERPE